MKIPIFNWVGPQPGPLWKLGRCRFSLGLHQHYLTFNWIGFVLSHHINNCTILYIIIIFFSKNKFVNYTTNCMVIFLFVCHYTNHTIMVLLSVRSWYFLILVVIFTFCLMKSNCLPRKILSCRLYILPHKIKWCGTCLRFYH